MTDKIHVLTDKKQYKIANKINTEDYIMIHKAELKLLAIKDAENRFGYKFFEILSSIIIGCEVDKIISGNFNLSTDGLILLAGIGYATYSIVCFIKRNNDIDELIKTKLNEI